MAKRRTFEQRLKKADRHIARRDRLRARHARQRASKGTFIQRSRAKGSGEKAFYHQEAGRMLRPFFELGADDETAIEDAVERHLGRVIDII